MRRSDSPVPPHFLVVVPGMMGSKLRSRRTGRLVWLDLDGFPLNPFAWDDWIAALLEEMTYPNPDLEPAGVLDQLMIMSPWVRQEQYGRLLEALAGMGYVMEPARPEAECNLHTFAYDWRQDIRITGRQLGEAIERWHVLHGGMPAWVIGHSMGGIAARWYIEKEGGKDYVSRLFLMASPWNGAPKTMHMMLQGMDLFLRARFNPLQVRDLTRRTVRSFPSSYQILPHQGYFLRDAAGREFDPFSSTAWLEDEAQAALLADGLRFNQELGTALSVETLCFFGRKRPTFSQGVAEIDSGGFWDHIAWETLPLGDGTVPESSAIHAAAQQKLPFLTSHGSIYAHPAVLEILRWELRDRFSARASAPRPGPRHALAVTTDREQYLPGATIRLTAELEGSLSEAAQERLAARQTPATMTHEAMDEVRDGRIHVQLAWQSGLPGNPPLPVAPEVVPGVLAPDPATGLYIGELQAPYAEGYYRLLSEVWLDGVSITDSDLLVVDDGHPGWSIDPVTGKVIARTGGHSA